MGKTEKVLIKALQKYGYALYVSDEPGMGGRRHIRNAHTHADLFYGNGPAREAFLYGMLCILRGEALHSALYGKEKENEKLGFCG